MRAMKKGHEGYEKRAMSMAPLEAASGGHRKGDRLFLRLRL